VWLRARGRVCVCARRMLTVDHVSWRDPIRAGVPWLGTALSCARQNSAVLARRVWMVSFMVSFMDTLHCERVWINVCITIAGRVYQEETRTKSERKLTGVMMWGWCVRSCASERTFVKRWPCVVTRQEKQERKEKSLWTSCVNTPRLWPVAARL
jgi:hypothetical protein